MSLPVTWRVSVNGRDVTDRMNDFIESIECTDKEGGGDDTATIVFNDNDGQCASPPKGADIEIELDGAMVFKGYTDAPESVVSRGGGMTLNVPCTSTDRRGKVKQRLQHHKDDCTLKEFLEDAAKKAGLSGIKVDPEFAEIKRDYWRAGGESFAHLGRRLAEEFGGTFKIRGKQAVLAKRGGGAPGGGALPTVYITRGDNLIESRIKPFVGRPRFAKARVRWYDRAEAKHKIKDVEIGAAPGADASDFLGEARPDEKSAGDAGKGRKAESEHEGGEGSCTILLAVEAQAGAPAIVSIGKADIDGAFVISSRTHRVNRQGMAETTLELKQPKASGDK